MDRCLTLICRVGFLFACFLGGIYLGSRVEREPVILERCDTVVRVDTFFFNHFREVTKMVKDTIYITLPAREKPQSDTLAGPIPKGQPACSASGNKEKNEKSATVADSAIVALPRETVTIRDSLFVAQISGYNPRLDAIWITTPTTTIKAVRSEKKRQKWGIGINAGVGVVYNETGIHTGVGAMVGVSYNF